MKKREKMTYINNEIELDPYKKLILFLKKKNLKTSFFILFSHFY